MEIDKYLLPTQEKLFGILTKKHKEKATAIKKSFILIKGEAPILLVAHMDTVHMEPVKTICRSSNRNILMSPQGIGGDDRCGVYALETIYHTATAKPWLLFTCDEETGGAGADTFAEYYNNKLLPKELDNIKLIIEIDRKGKNDAVYYSCDCPELENYISSKGFRTEYGSFSDISIIAPAIGKAAVNLSSGYYNAHTCHEYINMEELHAVISKTLEIVNESTAETFPVYKYKEKAQGYKNFSVLKNTGWIYPGNTYYGNYNSAQPCNEEYTRQQKYEMLLDIYDVNEMNYFIESEGEGVIDVLFEEEFGYGLQCSPGYAEDYCKKAY